MTAARRSPLFGYLAAVLIVLAAAALRLLLDPYLGDGVPLAFFFIGVTAVAFFGEFGPAVVASALSIVIGRFLFVPPRYAFALRESDFVVIVFFTLACGLVIGLATRVNRSRLRMEMAAASAEPFYVRQNVTSRCP